MAHSPFIVGGPGVGEDPLPQLLAGWAEPLSALGVDVRPHVGQALDCEGSSTQIVSCDPFVTSGWWPQTWGRDMTRREPPFPFYR